MASRRSAGLVPALLIALALAVPAARADGDPASDYLYTQNVFLPFGSRIPTEQGLQVQALVREANLRRVRLKVALIGAPYDLGAVPSLFGKPQQYASFLGQELRTFYRYQGPLLVVMPQGYGIHWSGRKTTRERLALATLPPPGYEGKLMAARAMKAVQRLGELRGAKLSVPPAKAKSGGRSYSVISLVALGLSIIALVGADVLRRRFRRRKAAG